MGSLSYFGGLGFLVWDEIFNCTEVLDRTWTNYCVLQFDEAGPLEYVFGAGAAAKSRRVEGAHAWVTYPGPRFRFGSPPGTSRTHRYVAFTGPRVEQYMRTGLIAAGPQPPIYPIPRPGRFGAEMAELFQCLGPRLRNIHYTGFPLVRTSAPPADMPNLPRAVHILEGLLLSMHESSAAELSDRWASEIGDLAHRISEHPEGDWNFHAEAKRLHITFTYFRHVFGIHVGMPPGRFLQQARLEQAAMLLRQTDQSIEEIARLVGIDDIYYFNKLFKRHHHIPPGRYRRELTKKRTSPRQAPARTRRK